MPKARVWSLYGEERALKLYNAVVIHDLYVVANSWEEACKAALVAVREGETPAEQTALEARVENNVRQSWREQKPFVGADISDTDFAKLKGKTAIEIYKMLYTKQPGAKK